MEPISVTDLLASPGEWARAQGPEHEIVISSRIRLARNLRDRAFPGWAKKEDRVETLNSLLGPIEGLSVMDRRFSARLEELSPLEKRVLVERHLISREHAAKGVGSAVVMNGGQDLTFMVNEEDHIRMQVLKSGLQLQEAYQVADSADTELEKHLEFAFHVKLGYLTACPTNVGTGLRASAMMHLPGLALNEEITGVVNSINKIGLAVRGLYGEGSEALGNLFQISNQSTLGESENEIITKLEKVVRRVVEHERNARQNLLEKKLGTLKDQIGRSYGILTNAHSLTSKETLNWLSLMRLGLDLGAYPQESQTAIDKLFMQIQPAHLQIDSERKLEADERDQLRAELVREALKDFPTPTILPPSADGSASAATTTTNE